MKCPLIASELVAKDGFRSIQRGACLQEECAWWNSNTGRCSVYSGALLLARLCEHLGQLAGKMPKEFQFRR